MFKAGDKVIVVNGRYAGITGTVYNNHRDEYIGFNVDNKYILKVGFGSAAFHIDNVRLTKEYNVKRLLQKLCA